MEHKFEKAKKFFTEIKKTVYLWKNLWKEGTPVGLQPYYWGEEG